MSVVVHCADLATMWVAHWNTNTRTHVYIYICLWIHMCRLTTFLYARYGINYKRCDYTSVCADLHICKASCFVCLLDDLSTSMHDHRRISTNVPSCPHLSLSLLPLSLSLFLHLSLSLYSVCLSEDVLQPLSNPIFVTGQAACSASQAPPAVLSTRSLVGHVAS